MTQNTHKHPYLSFMLRYGWIFIVIAALLILFLLNVSKPGTEVEGCLDGCAVLNEREPGVLRIVSLNLLHGFPRFEDLAARLDVFVDQVQALDADIILLQEVPWNRSVRSAARYLAERLGMNYLYYRANGNRQAIFFEEGEAILSRFPLKSPVYLELRPRAGFFEQRVVLGADVETHIGDISVFVTHLTHGEPGANFGQVDALLNEVQAHGLLPKVIAGDFNASPNSSQVSKLSRSWIDVYRDVNPEKDGFTCCIDDLHDPNQGLDKRIDYVFLEGDAADKYDVLDAQLVFDRPARLDDGWLWVSDHVGLMVTLGEK